MAGGSFFSLDVTHHNVLVMVPFLYALHGVAD
jgi:hypothetical protein